MYRTKSDAYRTVQGRYKGIKDDKIILEHNGRNNRVPVNMAARMTYSIAEQGGLID